MIRRVSPLLHTPLMSLTNALDAIAVVGAIVLAGEGRGTLATVLGTVGRGRGDQQRGRRVPHHGSNAGHVQGKQNEKAMSQTQMTEHVIQIAYLIATVLFILSLRWMSAPSTARRGVRAGELGMLIAIVGHPAAPRTSSTTDGSPSALVLGSIIGVPLGLVQMTAVPQRTALSHAFGALCVTLVGTAEYYVSAPASARRSRWRCSPWRSSSAA